MCTNLNVVPGINFNGTFEGSIPYAQALATIGYRWGLEKYIDVVGTYYGNNNTYFRPAFTELDGHVSYPLTDKISLLVTVRNMTNVYGSPVQATEPSNMIGAPAVNGPPYALFSEQYGPRAVIVTSKFHF